MATVYEILSAMDQANYCTTVDELKDLFPSDISFEFAGKPGPSRSFAINKQIHSTNIIEARVDHQNTHISADGIWTRTKGTAVAVRTADCLPIFLADSKASIVMAVHAGWRGLCAGILLRAIETFENLGISPSDISAIIGPAISRERYEVGPEVITAFYNSPVKLPSHTASLCVSKGKANRWFLDLHTAAMANLLHNGVPAQQITLLQICTWSDEAYFSYRREGDNVGSNISWIALT